MLDGEPAERTTSAAASNRMTARRACPRRVDATGVPARGQAEASRRLRRGGDRAAKLAGEQDTFADGFRVREGPRRGELLRTHVRMATAPERELGQRCLHQVAASRGLRASRDTRRALGGQRAVDGNRLSRAVSASATVIPIKRKYKSSVRSKPNSLAAFVQARL